MNLAYLPLALVLWAVPAMAGAAASPAAKDYKVYELGEIQVEGEKSAAKDVAITHVITAEDITATGSRTLPEALRFAPGLTVNTSGRKNMAFAPFTGFGREHTTVLIDGVPYYEPYQNDTNLNMIPADIVGRIDIMRGTPSVLYGPGGMGGVINIITKQATDRPTFTAYAQTGAYKTVDLGLQHGNRINNFVYWLSANHSRSDGWGLSGMYDPHVGNFGKGKGKQYAVLQDMGKRRNSDSIGNNIWGKMGFEPDKDTAWYVTGFYSNHEWGDPWNTREIPQYFPRNTATGTAAFTAFDRVSRYEDFGFDLDGKHKLADNLTARLKLFYHHHEDDYESYGYDPATKELVESITVGRKTNIYSEKSTYRDATVGGSMLLDWAVHPKNNLRMAAHYKKDFHDQREAEWTSFMGAHAATGSLALENEWRPVERLSLIAGVAYNWFDVSLADRALRGPGTSMPETMDSVDPMLGASYTFGDATRIYASAAHKSRFPSLKELFSTRNGNPKLQPEYAWNYIVGVERPFVDDTLMLGVSGFYSRITDRIYGERFNDIRYENYGDTAIYGVNADLTWTPLERLMLRLGYTHTHAQNLTTGRLTDKVTNVPEHKLTGNLRYTLPVWETRVDVTGVLSSDQYALLRTPQNPTQSTKRIGGYGTMNLRLTQPIGEHIEVYVQCSNIFDADYEDNWWGFPARGREFMAGIKATF